MIPIPLFYLKAIVQGMTQTQASLTEELNASMEEINSMAISLVDYAKTI